MNPTITFDVIKALVETCSELQAGDKPDLAKKLAPVLEKAEAYGWRDDAEQVRELIASQP